MKLRILNLAIVTLLFIPGGVLATEDWEKKWKDQGWVKIHLKLGVNTNVTLYGINGREKSSWIQYIHPDGKKASFQFFKGATVHILNRTYKSDGRVCNSNKVFWGDKEACRTLWKKGDLYMSVTDIGIENWVFTIKKGNPENIKY